MFGPYSPGKVHVSGFTTLGGTLAYVSPGVYRGPVFSTGVPLDGWTSTQYQSVQCSRYLEIVFTSAAAGGVVLTAYTVTHPDARFPASVAWHNKKAMATSGVLSLVGSSQFSDALEVLPFLRSSGGAVIGPHGTPLFNADGTAKTPITGDSNPQNRDIGYRRTKYGEIICHIGVSQESVVFLCGQLTIPDWPIRCKVGGVTTAGTIELRSDLTQIGSGTAHDGGGGAASDFGDGYSSAGLWRYGSPTITCDVAETYYWPHTPSGGDLGLAYSIAWTANCEDVSVTVEWSGISNYGIDSLTWTFTGLPFDWWRNGPYTSVAPLLSSPGGTARGPLVTLVLDLSACGYYY